MNQLKVQIADYKNSNQNNNEEELLFDDNKKIPKLGDWIGRGKFSEVFNHGSNSKYVIKRIKADFNEENERDLREIRILRFIDHKYIVKCYSCYLHNCKVHFLYASHELAC